MKTLLATVAVVGGVAVGLALYQQQRKRAPKTARGQSKRLTTAKPEAASEAASEAVSEAQRLSETLPVSETQPAAAQPAAAQPVPLPRTIATAPVEQKASEVAVGLAEEERASRVQASAEAESVASTHRRESVSKATGLADAERSSRVQASAEAEGVASEHRRVSVAKATDLASAEQVG